MEKGRFFEKVKKEYYRRQKVYVIVSILLMLSVTAFAWFSTNGLRHFFGAKKITQAYTLYLTDSKDNRPLELKTKIPPNINSRQEFVFKVNGKANSDDVDNKEVNYELEMAYTENLPVIYDLYKYDGSDYVELKNYTTDITDERRKQAYTDSEYELDYVNKYVHGQYRQYHDGETPYFEMIGGFPDVYKIVISWDRDRVNNPADLIEYNKETDLIYVVAREVSSDETNAQP